MKIFQLCKKYLIKYKFSLLIYVLINLVITLISILSTFIIGNFLDNLISSKDNGIIWRFSFIFLILNISKLLLGYITSILYVKMQMRMGNDFNRDVICYIQNLSLTFVNNNNSVYLNQKVNNDTNELIIFCITIIQSIIINAAMIVIPFIILFSMNPSITLLLVLLILIYLVLYKFFKTPIYKASFLFQENQSYFFSSLYEQFQYIKLIKINAIQKEINQRLDESFSRLQKSAVKKQRIDYFFSSVDNLIGICAQVILFFLGGKQVLNGNFTIGMFTIFSSYFNMMIDSSRYFFNLSAVTQAKLVSHKRLVDILNQKEECWGDQEIVDIEAIDIQRITFSYGEKKLFDDFNAELKRGNIYAIVGPNGKGKSTLIQLLLGFYNNERQGNIFYNNIDINEINMNLVRKKLIGFSEQEPLLINDTLRYNLTFGKDVELKKLTKYLEILNMDSFILNLDNGIDSIINEKNSNISGGEKQKISILKVLLKDSPVMIFDEPTSALDTETQKKFTKYLQQIKKEKIIIVITHDWYLKEEADIILEV